MSDISTSTPSGDGNRNLYETNPDTGRIEINFPEDFIEELDPEKEASKGSASASTGASTNTVAFKGTHVRGDEIRKVGFVGIPLVVTLSREQYENAKQKIKGRAAKSAATRDTTETKPEIENEGK